MMSARWTRDDEDAWIEAENHREHLEHMTSREPADCSACEADWRKAHPENYGDCLCDTADAPAHEDYS